MKTATAKKTAPAKKAVTTRDPKLDIVPPPIAPAIIDDRCSKCRTVLFPRVGGEHFNRCCRQALLADAIATGTVRPHHPPGWQWTYSTPPKP